MWWELSAENLTQSWQTKEFIKELCNVSIRTFSQDDFFLGKCFEAMEVDSLSSSHPVSTPVENPTQIQEMFDDVSYDKVSLDLSDNILEITMSTPSLCV